MKKRYFFIAVSLLLFTLPLHARRGQNYRAALTVHNSGRNAQPYYKPCVIHGEEGKSSIQGILSDLNLSLNPGHRRSSAPICQIRNSPSTRLVMIKPKDLNNNSLRSDLTQSIITKIRENLFLSIPKREHVMVSGYVPMFKEKALGGECDKCAWGGCAAGLLGMGDMDDSSATCNIKYVDLDSANRYIFNWYEGCYSFYSAWYTMSGESPTQTAIRNICENKSGATMHALNYSDHKEQYRDAVGHHYRYGHWVDFPFASALINDDLNPDKNPIFNCEYFRTHGATTICAPEDDLTPLNEKGYRGKIVVEGGVLDFLVNGKLSLRYLDIFLKTRNAKVRFFGAGTVELKGVSIYGQAPTDAMVELEESVTLNIKKIPGREDSLFGYGLGLFPRHSGIERYIRFYSSPENSQKVTHLLMQTWDNFPEYDSNFTSRHPALFLAPSTGGDNSAIFDFDPTGDYPRENIVCNLRSTGYDGTKVCALDVSSDQMPRGVFLMEKADGGDNAPNLYHMGLKFIPVADGTISFKGDVQLYSIAGNSIQVKEADFDPALIHAVTEIMNSPIQPFHNTVDFTAILLPPSNPDCPEGQHWDGAFEQCIIDDTPYTPDCGEARWDAVLQDCDCDSENRIYDAATKSCRLDDEADLPNPDDGSEVAEDEDDNPQGVEKNSGGCNLMRTGNDNRFSFSVFPLLFAVLFLFRQRTRGIF